MQLQKPVLKCLHLSKHQKQNEKPDNNCVKNICVGNISDKLRASISVQKELPQFNMKRNENSNSKAGKAKGRNSQNKKCNC